MESSTGNIINTYTGQIALPPQSGFRVTACLVTEREPIVVIRSFRAAERSGFLEEWKSASGILIGMNRNKKTPTTFKA